MSSWLFLVGLVVPLLLVAATLLLGPD